MTKRRRRSRSASAALFLTLACGAPESACGGSEPRPETEPKQTTAAAPVDAALAERLLGTVRALADDRLEGRAVGTAGAERARQLIVPALEQAGIAPLGTRGYASSFPAGQGVEGVNLLGTIGGRGDAASYIVLSAHYDHLGTHNGEIFNGADDNASGVSAVLEIARRIAAQPLEHSLIVALFDGEERSLRGSRAFVEQPPVPLGSIRLAVNLDMVARGGDAGLFASGTFHSPALRPVLERAAEGGPLPLHFGHDRPADGHDDWTDQSDHAPFHTAGLPFVYFGVEDHPDYHRPTDDWQKIDPAFFAASVLTIERSLRALDQALAAGLDARADH